MANPVLLKEPPRIQQFQAYPKYAEGLYACWAATAEMVIRWRSSEEFKRPQFENLTSGLDDDQRAAEYLSFVLDRFVEWGFEPQRRPVEPWTSSRMARALFECGPLICTGTYGGRGDTGDIPLTHAVVVFGINGNNCRYVDPWDGGVKHMDIGPLFQKMWISTSGVNARKANYRPLPGKMSYADPRFMYVDDGKPVRQTPNWPSPVSW